MTKILVTMVKFPEDNVGYTLNDYCHINPAHICALKPPIEEGERSDFIDIMMVDGVRYRVSAIDPGLEFFQDYMNPFMPQLLRPFPDVRPGSDPDNI